MYVTGTTLFRINFFMVTGSSLGTQASPSFVTNTTENISDSDPKKSSLKQQLNFSHKVNSSPQCIPLHVSLVSPKLSYNSYTSFRHVWWTQQTGGGIKCFTSLFL